MVYIQHLHSHVTFYKNVTLYLWDYHFIARGTRAILLVKKRPTFLFDWLRRLCSNVTFKGP